MTHFLIRDLENIEKPREKLLNKNIADISNTELLAIILSVGGKNKSALDLARELLKQFNNFKALASIDIQELIKIKDVGIAKACKIKAALEISQRINKSQQNEEKAIYINKPEDIFSVVKSDIANQPREHLLLLCLNSRNKLLSKDLLTVGTVNETLIHPREIFQKALLRNAVYIVIVHNHPSGDSSPSTEDVLVTKQVLNAGKNLGIGLLDHLIVTKDSYASLKSLGLMSG